ncbi:MAG: helix-turn-helix domain-containing protein [Syntrophobacterales bacterium]|nr:helix-turn-helix domain-containing protein [Syntrophobacterales bacterium]
MAKNTTQQQLAEQIGVSRPTVAKYEMGENEPTLDSLVKMSDILGVSVDVLLGRSPVNEPGIELSPKPVRHRDIIQGKALPDVITAQKIATALGVSIEELWPLGEEHK